MARADAVISRCFCPPERVRVPHWGHSAIRSQAFSMQPPIFSGEKAKFSQPNASSSSTRWWMICASAFCSTTPALRQMLLILCPDTSSPPMRTSPESVPLVTLGITPDRMERTVLFP